MRRQSSTSAMLRESAASVGQGKQEPHWRRSKRATGGNSAPGRIFSFFKTRATGGTVARLGVVPLSEAMVHVSIHNVVVWPLLRTKADTISRSAIGQLRPW